jgi:prespore-specific regulator
MMTKFRQDSWAEDEDLKVAEIVLRHIREGGTQTSAFKEASMLLNRSEAAITVRWNTSIKTRFNGALEIAKKARMFRKQTEDLDSAVEESEVIAPDLTPEIVLNYLKTKLFEPTGTNEQIKVLQERNEILELENHELNQKLSQLREEYKLFEEDYKVVMQIFDRAKKLSSF